MQKTSAVCTMKIATWNIERPKSSTITKNVRILEALKEVDADILVLSETNSAINLGREYTAFSTAPLVETAEEDGVQYGKGETRVTIWSKYPMLRRVATCSPLSAICVCVCTPHGELNVYGTILGFRGNRHPAFMADLEAQLKDWRTLSKSGHLCIAGDYNMTFSDNYYYTKTGRRTLNEAFDELEIDLLTRSIPENIDHIAISRSFSRPSVSICKVWNRPKDRKVSDHIGVCLTLPE